jgi:hypothetical protein
MLPMSKDILLSVIRRRATAAADVRDIGVDDARFQPEPFRPVTGAASHADRGPGFGRFATGFSDPPRVEYHCR